MKLVFFGDSLTQGTFGVSYLDKLAAAVRGHHFINQGINGDTSLNLYRRVAADVLAEKPDGCLVMVGINDAISHTEPGLRPYYRLAKRIPQGHISPIAFRENQRAVLTTLVQAGIRVWVALPPVEYRPALVDALREVNALHQELCAELNIPALDLLRAMTPVAVPERPPLGLDHYRIGLEIAVGIKRYEALQQAGGYTYSFDGIHLTDFGATRLAELLRGFLKLG
jgi:lysophospholipase L1-like esterase